MQLYKTENIHNRAILKYILNMRKFLIVCAGVLALTALAGCKKKQVNYADYISELRHDVYLYSDDGTEIKIYRTAKETPYSADGYKGEITELTEIFVKVERGAKEVEIDVGGDGGEMNYNAVENDYYLSFTGGEFEKNSCVVTLTVDKNEREYTLTNVLYGGVMDGKSALGCALEYDGETFAALTENGAFLGEIFIRLLYDDGCYYYVGVCDRNKNISAYLVDGVQGKIIASRKTAG